MLKRAENNKGEQQNLTPQNSFICSRYRRLYRRLYGRLYRRLYGRLYRRLYGRAALARALKILRLASSVL